MSATDLYSSSLRKNPMLTFHKRRGEEIVLTIEDERSPLRRRRGSHKERQLRQEINYT
jgi:hypothetical protein